MRMVLVVSLVGPQDRNSKLPSLYDVMVLPTEIFIRYAVRCRHGQPLHCPHIPLLKYIHRVTGGTMSMRHRYHCPGMGMRNVLLA